MALLHPKTVTRKLGKEADAITVKITKLGPRAQFVTFATLMKVVGPAAARLLTQDGKIEIDGNRYSIWAAMQVPAARRDLIEEAMKYLDTMKVEDLIDLCDLLLMNHCEVNGKPFFVDTSRSPEQRRELCGIYVDENFQDAWQILGAVRLACEINYSPSTADDTSADSSAGSTSADPEEEEEFNLSTTS